MQFSRREDSKGWTVYTNGASSQKGVGAGLVLIDPSGTKYTYVIRLNFPSTNNEAKYEALLAGLRIARKIKVQTLDIKVDSKLVACQMNGEFVASNEGMAKYLAKAKEQAALFKKPVCGQRRSAVQKVKLVSYVKMCRSAASELHNKGGARRGVREQEGPDNLMFIIVAIDYFTKWIKAKPLAKTTDNETQLVNDPFKSWCEKWKIKQMNTTVAHLQVNSLLERANKPLMYGLKARLGRERVGWVDELPNTLWAHRTMLKTSNGETSFSLTYESKAVIPAEIGMPTYQTIHFNESQNEKEMRLNLDLSQERKETATIREAKYKKKVEQYYNKRVRPMSFKVGNFVYRKNAASMVENQGKFGPNWEGPYRVTEA
nr:reverse transcriptase domain-containing protein [Tanacetum cinerariifolium]